MLTRFRFLALYFLFWIGCFEGGRLLFLLYQWRNTVRLNAGMIASIFLHGLRMDVSLVSAVMIVPVCIVARVGYLPVRGAKRLIAGYTIAILSIWSLGTIADLEIFNVWGFRLDASPLHYLTSSREALASAAGSPLGALAILLALLLAVGIFIFSRGLLPYLDAARPGQLKSVMLVALAAPGLVIGTRGGLDWRIPITAGSVYFSRNNFANQAAINPVWNFFASLISDTGGASVERFARPAIAQAIVDSLLEDAGRVHGESTVKLLRMRPKKIVIVFWESFTAKIAEPLGGLSGVTPGFTRLSKDGILFDQFYASGSRTTNGLIAGLTGMPSHPLANPLASREMGASLPRLSMAMVRNGYHTGFYYGASLAFENRNRFLLRGRYEEIVEKKDFPRVAWQSPWGVHDPMMLDRLFQALDGAKAPTFAVTLTLSSHEPFKVPGPAIIRGSDSEHRFLNAQAFSDQAITNFVDRARRAPWWDSTLIIILADHGHTYPRTGSPLAAAPGQFRIPMLWLGGALAVHDTVIHQIGSQSDIPETLLAQLGIAHSQFKWSKDFLSPDARQFAFYAFRNGFGYVDRNGAFVFDNVAKSVIYRSGNPLSSSVRAGRAFQQVVTQAYHDLSAPGRR
jgi:phosphoglycerol transferase MdoB-like AlkP superfamily enzyme